MFKDKKFTIPFIAELIMPCLILIPGILAHIFYMKSYTAYGTPEYQTIQQLEELFYILAMGGGMLIIFLECIIGFISFVFMIINICTQKKEPYCIIKPLILWLSPLAFNFGTLILMFLVQIFTYAQSV